MKKLFIMIALAAMALSGIAKNNTLKDDDLDSREVFFLGIKGGANYSNIYDSQGDEFKADGKFGVAAGVFLGIPLGRYFGLQPEALFSQRGFKGTGKVAGLPFELTRTSNYIDVPLFLALKPASMITVLVGPQFSFLVNQTDNFSNSLSNSLQTQAFDGENIRKNTVCGVIGMDISISRFVLGARAGMDLMNNNGDGTSSTPRYKNAWVQATIGFKLL